MKARHAHIGILACLTALVAALLCSCADGFSDEYEIYNPDDDTPPYFVNNPLQKRDETYKILAIGNSYTDDGTAYIGDIAKGLGIDTASYCVYTLTKGSTSLKHWSSVLQNDKDTVTIYRKAGTSIVPTRKSTLVNILAQDWDVVVLQQLSSQAINYATYNPHLRQLIDGIRAKCTNPDVAIAWQLIHAYSKGNKSNKGLVGDDRWRRIVNATQIMKQRDGIDIIIPTGTAIQIARHTDLNNASDLTRDNTHLCYGVGRYIAACCWVQTLFSPVYGCDIQQCTSLHPLTESESQESYEGFIPSSSQSVTQENRSPCLQCVAEACAHPFSLN